MFAEDLFVVIGRWEEPRHPPQVNGKVAHYLAGITAMCSCLHRDHHSHCSDQTQLQKLTLWIPFIECYVWCVEQAHECVHTEARTGHQVFPSITFCLKKGSLTELEAHFCQAGCQASHIRLWSLNAGVTGPAQLFTWLLGMGIQDPCLQNKCPYPLNHFLSSFTVSLRWQNDRIGQTKWHCQDRERWPGNGRGLKLENEFLCSVYVQCMLSCVWDEYFTM